eukprot:CAMPEP_0119537100 /NCGR_PEP_ID=MMETSP1344-20130328/49855_1 /TAXON_ID=236787 /ORGANISM="Florenciella parvula, Strain CCMP2471" /LENGTH=189 /DNA_ID=CAMNT_0007579485 /DNA_START=9 /DNA_END=578 /DNA_ORIENTATION=-
MSAQQPRRRKAAQSADRADDTSQEPPTSAQKFIMEFPVLVLWTGIFCASSWALCFPLALPRRVLESPLIWRLPFHGGVFCTIGAFIVKWYMEVYQAGIMGQQINYESNPRATHLLLGLIGSAWLMLVVGLWPQYHVFSLLVVALFGIGVLFPVTMWSVMYGRSVENVIFMVATTYFVFWYTGDSGDLVM